MPQQIEWSAELEARFEDLADRYIALHPSSCPKCGSNDRSERKFIWRSTVFGSDGSRCSNGWHDQEEKHGE